MLLYNLHVLKAIINQLTKSWFGGSGGGFLWPCHDFAVSVWSAAPSPAAVYWLHRQTRWGSEEGLPAVCGGKLSPRRLPNSPSPNADLPAQRHSAGLERLSKEERQSGRAAGIRTTRREASRPPGVLAGGQLCWGHGAGVCSPGLGERGSAGCPCPPCAQPGTSKNAAFLLGLFC